MQPKPAWSGDQTEDDFFAHAEAMLRDVGTALPQQLHRQDNLEAAALPVRIGLAGLFYYLGIVLRHLEQKGLYKRSLGGVFVGGNGAQLLHWADGGEYDPSGPFAKVLTDCLFAGTRWAETAPKNVQIKLSTQAEAGSSRWLGGAEHVGGCRRALGRRDRRRAIFRRWCGQSRNRSDWQRRSAAG